MLRHCLVVLSFTIAVNPLAIELDGNVSRRIFKTGVDDSKPNASRQLRQQLAKVNLSFLPGVCDD